MAAAISTCSYANSSTLKIDINRVTVSNAIHLIYAELNEGNFILDPEIVSDQRLVSFRFSDNNKKLKPFLHSFLSTLGYNLQIKPTLDLIKKIDTDSDQSFFYHPKNRSVTYLTRTLSPFFAGKFTNSRQIPVAPDSQVKKDSPPGSAASYLEIDSEVLSFTGSQEQISKLKEMLKSLDTRPEQLRVQAAVLEVGNSDTESNAITQITNLLNGSIQITTGSELAGNPGSIKLKFGNFEAALKELSQNSNFKIISSPTLQIKSGEQGSFNAGQEVPTLGSTSFQNGTAIQSIDYRSSGVIFKIKPTVFTDSIDLTVDQEISNFVQTENGVNGSPTLSKRSVTTKISLLDGEVILLGGLADQKTSTTRSSFLGFLTGRESKISNSQIFLVLKAEKVSDPT